MHESCLSDALDLLKKYWGFDAFRAPQEEIILNFSTGKHVFAVLPTGGGKSLCYQLPALLRDGCCLVVSPLIALMMDQVKHLVDKGIPAACLHSGLPRQQINRILDQAIKGDYKLLYLSPERLLSAGFLDEIAQLKLNGIAVDEAHCISQWGHDFRPAYLQVSTLKKLFPGVPFLALTASATPAVQKDIFQYLELENPLLFKKGISRPNLSYRLQYSENKVGDMLSILKAFKGSGIVYCRSRKKCSEVAAILNRNGHSTAVYHAGLKKAERHLAQEKWMSRPDCIICATTAFGMGIDKPDVRVVMHIDVPASLEEYYQEAGRAGRDGQESLAIMLYNQQDITRLRDLPDIQYPELSFIRKCYQSICDYLQIPVNAGKERLFPFDTQACSRAFKLDIVQMANAVKVLEQENHWVWEGQTQTQSTIQLSIRRDTLGFLEKKYPRLSEIITGLLRLHSGIHYAPVPFKLYETARLLEIEQADLIAGIRKLQSHAMLDFYPAVSGSTLYFLQERVPAGQLRFQKGRLKTLKLAFQKRVDAMIGFIENTSECRNTILAHYFGERLKSVCGKCDNCTLKSQNPLSGRVVEDKVRKVLRENREITVQSVTSQFSAADEEQILEVLRWLQEEGVCRIYPNGIIYCT